MKLPWKRGRGKHRLALRASEELFAYVLVADAEGQALPRRVLKWGALRRAEGESAEAFAARQRELGLQAGEVIALPEQGQYQFLKVDTPNVPPDELKAAARWQIKEYVDGHLDDITLDVLHEGDERERAQRHLFVVAARNKALAALNQSGAEAGLTLDIIDVWETALRNLQTAQAGLDGLGARACAALLMFGERCLLTISANEELFYTRMLDGDARLTARATGAVTPRPVQDMPLGYEYTPGDDLVLRADTEESALVIELQRSIDVWERSWPDLPLARLYLVTADAGEAVATLLQRELGLRTTALDLDALFSGLAGLGERKAELADCLPLLGASLRHEARKL